MDLIGRYITNAVESLNELNRSLQKEFEYYSSIDHPNEKVLKAKKKQQNTLDHVFWVLEEMSKKATGIDIENKKLRGCLLFHGVSPNQVEGFLSNSLTGVELVVKESFTDKIVQVPERLSGTIKEEISDPANEEIEIRRELTKVLNPKYYTKKNNNVKSDQKSTS